MADGAKQRGGICTRDSAPNGFWASRLERGAKELTFSPVGPMGPASPGRPERPLGPSGPSSPLGPADPISPWKAQHGTELKHNESEV